MKFALMGDVMLGRLVNQILEDESAAYPWGDTLPVLAEADLRICNLECVIADSGIPWPKTFNFRTDSKNVQVLKEANIEIVSIANNHVLDYGYTALLEMLEVLDRAGIAHAGAGRDLSEAMRPAVIETHERMTGLTRTTAFIAFTDNEPDWEARSDAPGIHYVPTDVDDPRAARLIRLIETTAPQADHLIVSAHWGPNWGDRPLPQQIEMAHAMTSAGADIVFGHSNHVTQGIEVHQGRPIIYSAGDFIDDYAIDPYERNDLSFIFELVIEADGLRSLRLQPTVISDFQARLSVGTAAEFSLSRIARLSRSLGTNFMRSKEGKFGHDFRSNDNGKSMPAEVKMTSEENKQLVQRWFNEFLNTGNTGAAQEIASLDFEFHFLGDDTDSGLQGVIQQLTSFRSAFPDLHYTTEKIICEGDRCAAQFTITGTHQQEFLGVPASGNRFKIRGVSMLQISDGQIKQVTPVFDRAGMLQQLGARLPGQAAA